MQSATSVVEELLIDSCWERQNQRVVVVVVVAVLSSDSCEVNHALEDVPTPKSIQASQIGLHP